MKRACRPMMQRAAAAPSWVTTFAAAMLVTAWSTGVARADCPDQDAALTLHNSKRELHGAPIMEWNATLAQESQEWADNLASAGCGLVHSTGNWGENLSGRRVWGNGATTQPSCVDATNSWYKEIEFYIFKTSTPYTDNSVTGKVTGHFTQVVWMKSVQLGCGAAVGDDGKCAVEVCRYLPSGNWIGDDNFKANVKPVGGGDDDGTPSPPPGVKEPPSPPPEQETPLMPPSPPPPPPPKCVDKLTWCKDWAQRGYCDPQWEYEDASVRDVQCPVACGTCVPASQCADRLTWCPSWAKAGYCDAQYIWEDLSVRDVHCQLSCRTCTTSSRRFLQGGNRTATTSGNVPVPESEILTEDPDGSEGGSKPKKLPDVVLVGYPLYTFKPGSLDGSKRKKD